MSWGNRIKVGACLLLACTLLLSGCSKREKTFDWEKHYEHNKDQPYDLIVFHELLREKEGGLDLLTNNFERKMSQAENANYIQIGSYIQLDSSKIGELKRFVHRGNNAYLVSESTPYYLFRSLYDGFSYPYYSDTGAISIEVSFEGSEQLYAFEHINQGEPGYYYWSHMRAADTLFSDTAGYPEAISYFNDTCVNFYKVSFGEGAFYFHTQPVLFTNIMLKETSGFEHLQRVFQELNSGVSYWDISYRYRQPRSKYSGSRGGGNGGSGVSSDGDDTPHQSQALMRMMFSDISLQWGWLVLLTTILLFILFRSKRKQRVIPVLPLNRNESLDFARNVGNLYFTSKNHKHIALEMYNIFLADARNRYQIDTNQAPEKIFKQLTKRSGLDQTTMDKLFEHFTIRFSEYSKSEQLIHLYNALNNYYKTRK